MFGPGFGGENGAKLGTALSSGVMITGVEQIVEEVISEEDNEDCPEF